MEYCLIVHYIFGEILQSVKSLIFFALTIIFVSLDVFKTKTKNLILEKEILDDKVLFDNLKKFVKMKLQQ